MKFDWKKALKICLCVFILFLCITYWQPFVGFFGLVVSAAEPLILGGFIAFIVNILMTRYEKWFFPKKKAGTVAKIRRPICMLLSFLTVVIVLAAVIWLIVPQLMSCIQVILAFIAKLPNIIKELITKADNWEFIPDAVLSYLSGIDWEAKIEQFAAWLTSGVGGVVNTVANTVAKTVMGVVSGVVTAVLSLIFSIYLLLDKDKLKRQFRKLSENYLPEKIYRKFFYLLRVLNESFRKFIVGQLTEAVILGVLCTIGMLIFGLPYATMVGALIAFTALIPIAGAYIGAITGALMILTVSPAKAIVFLIFIVVLQQLEGNIIYPRVVGSSIGLPGIWVLAAVTVGGGCFGIPGMLIGVPLTSAIYRIIRENLDKKAKNKEKSAKVSCEKPNAEKVKDLPQKTQKN